MSEVQKLRPSRLFLQALRESDLNLFQKLRLRTLYLVPSIRESIDEYIDGVVGTEAVGDGTIIKIILEHLPEIMALIELIIKLLV